MINLFQRIFIMKKNFPNESKSLKVIKILIKNLKQNFLKIPMKLKVNIHKYLKMNTNHNNNNNNKKTVKSIKQK